MGLLQENKYTNISGTFPNAIIIDASGAGLTDGSEYAALQLNDNWDPFQQAVMSYASGVTTQNLPTGSVGVPNGVADAVGVSQMLEALQKSIGNGPGNYTLWGNELDPSVTGDRIILLSEQGVLIAVYPALDAANWIGGNTAAQVAAEAAGQKFYRSSDAAGAVGDAAGPYLQLPAENPTFQKRYTELAGDFTITGTNWTTTRAETIVKKSSGGTWYMIGRIQGSVTLTTSVALTMSGIVTATGAQAIPVDLGVDDWNRCRLDTTNIFTVSSGTAFTTVRLNFAVLLASKPTWADDFDYKWGIRY